MNVRRKRLLATIVIGLLLPTAAHADRWEDLQRAAKSAYRQGDYNGAVINMRAALEEAERFGPEDPRLTVTLNNLAVLYWAQGNYGAAEPLYMRSLTIREKALGPDHPDVATSLNSLAVLYHSQGNYGAAEPLFKRSLAIREKALDPDHPDVAQSLESYAALMRKTGHDDEAVKLERRAATIRKKRH